MACNLFLLPYTTVLPRLAAAERLFLFGIKKTSEASLNPVKNINTHEKTKNAG